MWSTLRFSILYLLFYNIHTSDSIRIEGDEEILALASNGHILAVALPSKMLFYSMTPSNNQTTLEELFAISFDTKLPEENFEFQLLDDNRFVLCSVDACRLYNINSVEKSAHLLLKINTGFQFRHWSSVILDDKVLISFLPTKNPNAVLKSYDLNDGHLVGEAPDNFFVKQRDRMHAFKRGSYSYFISTVDEPDLYSKHFGASDTNVTRTRLTRICNDDNSQDLVTKTSIHLACGQRPNEYRAYPTFEYQSSFLSTDNNRLFVVFNVKEENYLSCSYSMHDIEHSFDQVWNDCQSIKNRDDFFEYCKERIEVCFENECFCNKCFSSTSCTFSWVRKTSSKFCEQFGYGLRRKLTNCQASSYNITLSRYGWLENFIPIWGKIETSLSTKQHFSGLDDNTFITLSQDGFLRRLFIDAQQNSSLWLQNADKFTTVQNGDDQSSYVIYSSKDEVVAQQMTCSALYPNCVSIKWEDPLKCSYCAFSNSTGYVTDFRNNQSCTQSNGKVVFEQCAPVISKLQVTADGVLIVGALLENFVGIPTVFVCEQECTNVNLVNNLIECKATEAVSSCDVKISGSLKHTPEYTLYLSNPDYDSLEDYDTTTASKAIGRTTKFVIGTVVVIFFLAIISLIGYVITHKSCGINDNPSASKSFVSMHNTEFRGGLDSLVDAYNPISSTEVENLENYGLTIFPNYNRIEMVKTIGRGNFATVYLYCYKNSPKDVVAVKEITDLREMKLISQCRHPNIVQYFGYFRGQGKYFLVMEYLAGGDLHNYLINRENQFSCGQGFDMVLQIVNGMLYLARNHIIHRDLAARNCMMSADHSTIKISDFGLGRKTDANEIYQQLSETKLPYRWTAFECLKGDGFTEKSDVWSFGVLIWEIFSRARTPYANIKSIDGVREYLTSGERLSHPGEGCPDELRDIMLDCWKEDPSDRPTFSQLHDTIQAVIKELNDSDVDYAAIYLTPRISMNDGNNSSRTIMDESDISKIIHSQSNTPNAHITFT